MTKYKPVTISKASFAFCRFGIAVFVWLAFIFTSKALLGVVCFLFLLSSILKVAKAPMIKLYDISFQRLHKKSEVIVDEHAIFFAHLIGLAMSLLCLSLVYFIHGSGSWYVVLGFAILKTISALGFCPASKLYECSVNGNCCVKKGKKIWTNC